MSGIGAVSLLGLKAENKDDSRVTGEDWRKKLRVIKDVMEYFIRFLYF